MQRTAVRLAQTLQHVKQHARMSTATATATGSVPTPRAGSEDAINPGWKSLMNSVMAENMKQGNKDSLNVQLATLPVTAGGKGRRQRPSNRTVVFRGFVGQARKEGEPTGGNPVAGVESSLVVVSTDRLMLKAAQVASQQKTADGADDGENGFEVCWWHQGTQEQIRFNGRAWLLLPEGHDNAAFPGDRLKQTYVRVGDGSQAKDDTWTWEGERRRQFAKHSPGLKASFSAPTPASDMTREKRAWHDAGKKLDVSAEEECKDDEEARKMLKEALDRFSLLVLEVEEVDYLKVEPPAKRTRWSLNDGRWVEREISP